MSSIRILGIGIALVASLLLASSSSSSSKTASAFLLPRVGVQRAVNRIPNDSFGTATASRIGSRSKSSANRNKVLPAVGGTRVDDVSKDTFGFQPDKKSTTILRSSTSHLDCSNDAGADQNDNNHDCNRNDSNYKKDFLVLVDDDDKRQQRTMIDSSNMDPEDQRRGPKVQRYYNTYEWRYRSAASSNMRNDTTDSRNNSAGSSISSSNSSSKNGVKGTEEEVDSDIRTFRINYRREGNPKDPPILLIHGFGANVNHFRYNIPLLIQSGYQVYAIDLLGFGASDKPKDQEYSISLWVDLLCDFVRDMNHQIIQQQQQQPQQEEDSRFSKKWVVCGNSIGGLCSLGLTARMKDNVRGCVLFNCAQGMSGFRYEEAPFWLRPIMYLIQNVVLAPDGYGGKFFENFKTRENVQSILLNQGVYGDTTNVNDELLEILLGPSEDDGAKEVFLKVFGGPAGPTPEEFLKEIECPILALWGDSDPWVPVDRGTHQGLNFGNYTKAEYQLEILQGVGHCPHDEVPVEIHERMLPWLQSLDLK